jgi:glycosyltransferase involved in cell wall biosynthesis
MGVSSAEMQTGARAERLAGGEQAIDVSIVIPAFNEAGNVTPLYEEITRALAAVRRSVEIIFVDDGSTDSTYAELQRLHAQDPRVKVIRFQGNFGKAAAYSAGFEHAMGKYVLTMDADLQDDPAEAPKFLEKLDEGYDFVSGWKFRGKGPAHKRIPSLVFNAIVRRLTGLRLHDLDCPFRGFRREVLTRLKLYGELYRYIPILVARTGFRMTEVPVENRPRRAGQSKFGAERFVRGGLDLFTILFLTRYLGRPLHLFGGLGLLAGGLGFAIVAGLYVVKFTLGIPILNMPFFFAMGVLAMILGAQLFSLGLVCQLMIELSKRPGDNYHIQTRLT